MNRMLFLPLFLIVLVTALLAGCGNKSSSDSSLASTIASITATAGSQQVTVTWVKGSTSKATSYNLYWSTSPGVTKNSGTKITGATSPYIHTGLTNGTTYYYVVTEVTSSVEGAESLEVSATPKADSSTLSSVTATASNQQVTVAWVKGSTTKATSYNLYWSTAQGVTKNSGTKITGATSPYIHSGLTNGTTYYYVVTEVVSGAEGLESVEASATPKADASTLSVISVASANQQATLVWSKGTASKATGYNLYWSNSPGVSQYAGAKIANVVSPYIHTGLNNGVMYYYMLTEITNGADGLDGMVVGVTPKADIPVPPTGITISPLDGSVQIAITRNSSAATAKYNVNWSSDNDSVATKISNAFGAGSTFLHTGLTNGKKYYYAITVETSDGESLKSPTIMAVPLADVPAVDYVKGVSVASIGTPNAISVSAKNQTVTYTWSMPTKFIPAIFDPASTPAVAPIISSYTIYFSKDLIVNTNQAYKITVPATSKTTLPLTFVHNTELTNYTPYYYTINATAATDAAGTALKTAAGVAVAPFVSGFGSQTGVVPVIRIPPAPSGFTATSGSQQISLKWNKDASSSTYYRLYVSTMPPQKPEDVITQGKPITIATTTYTHTGLQSGQTYYYVITAVDEAESAPSALIAVSLR